MGAIRISTWVRRAAPPHRATTARLALRAQSAREAPARLSGALYPISLDQVSGRGGDAVVSAGRAFGRHREWLLHNHRGEVSAYSGRLVAANAALSPRGAAPLPAETLDARSRRGGEVVRSGGGVSGEVHYAFRASAFCGAFARTRWSSHLQSAKGGVR